MSASSESSNVTLRMIDFFTIPKVNGDCVVLLLVHPGLNLLGRYFPPSKVNDLLLADVSRSRPPNSNGDIYMMGVEEPDMIEDMEPMENWAHSVCPSKRNSFWDAGERVIQGRLDVRSNSLCLPGPAVVEY